MPIGSIILQPAADSLNAAYRPIVFQVAATGTDGGIPPVVYCDIYVNDAYYKSQAKTQANGSSWQFDIQDACQEVLKSIIALNGGNTVVPASASFATIQCKFRSSGFDDDGFITAEDTAPVQGTGSASPVAGTGTASNSFYVVNATLQHDQNQDLEAHLNSYKQGTWAADAYPLSHRGSLQGGPDYRICQDDSDYFPIVYRGDGTLSCVQVNYTMRDGTTGSVDDCGAGPGACPILSGIVIAAEDLGNGDQQFSFTWSTPDPLLTSVTIQYRPTSGGSWTGMSGSISSGRTLVLPLGLYDFRFLTNGSCTTTTSPEYLDNGIEAPTCAPPTIPDSPDLETGITGAHYSSVIHYKGSGPITIIDFVGPDWMNATLAGGDNVALGGDIPLGAEGFNIPVSFSLENDCGSVDYEDTFDIETAERTLTFQMGATNLMYAVLNHPIDVDFTVDNMLGRGYASNDCTGSEIAQAVNPGMTVAAGQTLQSVLPTLTGNWSLTNSFTLFNISTDVTGFIFPGDVVTIGSYLVTIFFDGC